MARYCKRHRKMPLITGHRADGTATISAPVPALITRYRIGARRKKPRYVYYTGGTWYRARNAITALDPSGKPCAWEWALDPIDGATAYDAHAEQTAADGRAPLVTLTIERGRVKRATGCKGTPYAGVDLLDGTETPEYVADLLDLNPTRRRVERPRGKHFKVA